MARRRIKYRQDLLSRGQNVCSDGQGGIARSQGFVRICHRHEEVHDRMYLLENDERIGNERRRRMMRQAWWQSVLFVAVFFVSSITTITTTAIIGTIVVFFFYFPSCQRRVGLEPRQQIQ
jgi:hypothetical protein